MGPHLAPSIPTLHSTHANDGRVPCCSVILGVPRLRMDERTLIVYWRPWNTLTDRGRRREPRGWWCMATGVSFWGIRGFMRGRVVRLLALLAVLTGLVPVTAVAA